MSHAAAREGPLGPLLPAPLLRADLREAETSFPRHEEGQLASLAER